MYSIYTYVHDVETKHGKKEGKKGQCLLLHRARQWCKCFVYVTFVYVTFVYVSQNGLIWETINFVNSLPASQMLSRLIAPTVSSVITTSWSHREFLVMSSSTSLRRLCEDFVKTLWDFLKTLWSRREYRWRRVTIIKIILNTTLPSFNL